MVASGQSVPVVEEELASSGMLPRITKASISLVATMDRYGSKQEKLVALDRWVGASFLWRRGGGHRRWE